MNRRIFLKGVAAVAAATGFPSIAAAALRSGEDCFLVGNNVQWWPGMSLSDLVPILCDCDYSGKYHNFTNFAGDVRVYGIAMIRDGRWFHAKLPGSQMTHGDSYHVGDDVSGRLQWRQLQG